MGLSPRPPDRMLTVDLARATVRHRLKKEMCVEKNGMSPDNEKTRLNPTYAHTQGVSGAAGSRVLFFSILSVALLH